MSRRCVAIAWTVAVLLFINLLNYMDRYTIAGIISELQKSDRSGFNININDKEAGLLQTSFIISFMLFSPIFGYLGDRYTRKYLMAVGLFFWSAFVFAGSFSVNYPMLLATRCLVGIGEASYATIAPTILADLFPVEKRLRILSLFYMAIPIGSAVGYGAGAGASSIAHNYFHVQHSWKWALRISPAFGLLAVVLVLFTIIEPPRGGEDPRNKEGVKGKSGIRAYAEDFISLMKNPTFMLTTFGFTALTFAVGAFAQWAPTLILRMSKLLSIWQNTKPYSETLSSGLFGGITVVAGLVGTIAGSELSKLISRKTEKADCIVCAIGLLGCSPLLFLALTLGNYNMYLSWFLVFIGEVSLCLTWAPVAAVLLYVVVPERRSTAEAIQILVIHLLGDAASPTITGAISDKLEDVLSASHDEIFSKSIGMQYALYTTTFIAAIGGGFFLFSTLTVEKDKAAVTRHVMQTNTVYKDTDDGQESLASDIVVSVKPSINEDYEYNENDPLLS